MVEPEKEQKEQNANKPNRKKKPMGENASSMQRNVVMWVK